MTVASRVGGALSALLLVLLARGGVILAQAPPRKDPPPPAERKSSFAPVVVDEPFESVRKRMTAAKAGIQQKHAALLAERYDSPTVRLRTRRCSGGRRCRGACGPSSPPG